MFNTLAHVLFLVLSLSGSVVSLTPAQWSQLSIYQLLTDRYATPDGSAPTCWIRSYCGGTWKGIQNKLDYIQGMGFDAIWISPVVHQIEDNTHWGYAFHGYWQDNPFQLNEHFGTPQDLKDLAAALHSRGMYLMVDVVINHFASNAIATDVDYSQYPSPFNTSSAFHPPCNIDYNNQTSIQSCWLVADTTPVLPDVKSENASVFNPLVQSVVDLVQTYGIDGIRLDTARHVPRQYLAQFQAAVGVFVTGEVFNGDPNYVATYQGPLNSVLNYPLFWPLFRGLLGYQDFQPLASMIQQEEALMQDVNVLTNFVDNHDNPRMASLTGDDVVRDENAAAFLMFTSGIPIIYYGFEQRFNGSGDPDNRETLWSSGYNTSALLYRYIARLHRIRSFAANSYGRDIYFSSEVKVLANSTTNLAMQRGPLTVVISNTGAQGNRTITVVDGTGLAPNAGIVDLLSCSTATTDAQGRIHSSFRNGQARIWALQSTNSGLCELRTG